MTSLAVGLPWKQSLFQPTFKKHLTSFLKRWTMDGMTDYPNHKHSTNYTLFSVPSGLEDSGTQGGKLCAVGRQDALSSAR